MSARHSSPHNTDALSGSEGILTDHSSWWVLPLCESNVSGGPQLTKTRPGQAPGAAFGGIPGPAHCC